MAKPKTDIPSELRLPLLEAALPHVPFDGWSDHVMTMAAQDLDIDPGIAKLAFPDGPAGMTDLLSHQHDDKMIECYDKQELSYFKIREKITFLIRKRIEAEQNIKEVARRSVTYLSLPGKQTTGLKILYRTVDVIWKTINDPSTDFNYYTKRITLSAVYSSVFLYWLNDDSEDHQATWKFLDRRIDNVMQIEKAKAQVRELTTKLPDFWQDISQCRYPSKR